MWRAGSNNQYLSGSVEEINDKIENAADCDEPSSKLKAPAAEAISSAAAPASSAEMIKWGGLALLVVQNSSLFVVTRYSRLPRTDEVTGEQIPMYISSAVVLVVELCKMLICLTMVTLQGSSRAAGGIMRQVFTAETLRLAIPAACYSVQNNLVFVAISNLSAAAAQVLYQLKTLTTALFSVLLLGRSFKPAQWASFLILALGVVLVQSQDAKSAHAPTGASPALGVVAALSAATLSGFAGVYLEKMFTTGSTSLWMRNVQLALFSIPLQLVAIAQWDGDAVLAGGLLQGFSASTAAVVAVQVAGALLTAFVIKFAGNVLKTFATVLALLCTCGVSTLLFDFHPTPLFGLGVAATAASIWLYASPSLRANAAAAAAAVELKPADALPPFTPTARGYAT